MAFLHKTSCVHNSHFGHNHLPLKRITSIYLLVFSSVHADGNDENCPDMLVSNLCFDTCYWLLYDNPLLQIWCIWSWIRMTHIGGDWRYVYIPSSIRRTSLSQSQSPYSKRKAIQHQRERSLTIWRLVSRRFVVNLASDCSTSQGWSRSVFGKYHMHSW